MERNKVFGEIVEDYLAKVAAAPKEPLAARLGFAKGPEGLAVDFLAEPYLVTPRGVLDAGGRTPHHAVSVTLFKYILLCPEDTPQKKDWVRYRDFADAAPFAVPFTENAEKPLAKAFSGDVAALAEAAAKLGGSRADIGVSADLCTVFPALPRVPVLLIYNDRDEEFPAQCSILFEQRAEKYLDMECLAMVGWLLAARLIRAAGKEGRAGELA
ncbi:MAG: DUF3786 domain-containing protein [Thermodesulfobacteriota bacterium]